MRRVLIFGYYGFRNTGDEAILAAMLRDLSDEIVDLEAVVVSGNPAATSQEHGVRAVLFTNLSGIIDAARESDAILLGGGGLFHDYWGAEAETVLSADHGSLAFVSAAPLLSTLLGKPLMIYAVGVGPLGSETGRRMTRAAFAQASVATVRDEASRSVLADAGVDPERVVVTADPAFRLAPAPPELAREVWRREVPGAERPVLGVALRSWDFGVAPEAWEASVAQGLDAFLQERPGSRVLFLPFQDTPGDLVDDRAVAERVRTRMTHAERSSCLSRTLPPVEMAALVARCDALLAMRLHAAIFALGAGVPVVALSYDPKVRRLLEEAGFGGFVLDLPSLEASSVSERLARALGDRESLRAADVGRGFHAFGERTAQRDPGRRTPARARTSARARPGPRLGSRPGHARAFPEGLRARGGWKARAPGAWRRDRFLRREVEWRDRQSGCSGRTRGWAGCAARSTASAPFRARLGIGSGGPRPPEPRSTQRALACSHVRSLDGCVARWRRSSPRAAS